MATPDYVAGVTGNPMPLIFDPGGMNPLADSIPGNEYSSGLDPPQITWTSIFYSKIDPPVHNQKTNHSTKYEVHQRRSGGYDCGLLHMPQLLSIINSQGI